MLDRSTLPFAYMETPYYVKATRKDGSWSAPELVAGAQIQLSIAAVCLHYGQALFEGMKAYRHADGRVALFRPEENAKRMQASAERLCMQAPDTALFIEAVHLAVTSNIEFLPPYGIGATMYIRPLLIGSGAQIGVKPSNEYTFLVMVMPVGPYYKDGITPIKAQICRDYVRACPGGTGAYKVAGNYASALLPGQQAKKAGYSVELYLDAIEHKYIDECGTANFFAIKDKCYITPASSSILPSITNMSLMDIARNMGLEVTRRPIAVDELSTFDEAGACGTAAVITPIEMIFDPKDSKEYRFGTEIGPISKQLYDKLTKIQNGDVEDDFGWLYFVE